MDRLLSMTVFAKAVELGSFSAAADAFRMSPQLVGKHVQMLEQHLGVRLLNRTTRRQHLTEIGANYYEKVKVILAEVESAEGLAAESKARPSGRLRINAPVSFGIHALMPRLTEYMAAYPEVQVEVSLANRYVDALEEGADAVFRVGELSDSSRIARRLAPYRLILCAAPAYLNAHPPIKSPPDLASHECLGFAYTELRTHWSFNGPEGLVTVPVSGRLMIDSGEALLMAARAGMGVLLQPAELIEPELETGRLVHVLPKYRPPDRPLHLLYAPDRQMTPKLRSFIEFAVAAFGTHKA
ncbi:DNA-binding transcriptional regulator, LysR family [Janthinobacterium sp. OK676]|uniref:LysR family transcriptional regulator n=1 Tax=Janthinobacterium sp. OK676 TaxID=1855295 RepID=UPI000880CAD1|nr:LysR family transcriptional regulator [Janthinobacterium sp. OK676]SDL45456.1 DNA-binding transcriptional regulator, LysR family [Janthinobacterium sp. OK676]